MGTLCLGAHQGETEPRGRFVWEHVGRGGAMGTLYLRGKYMFSVVSKPQERGPIGVKHRPCFSRSVSMRRTRTGASGVIVREGNDRHPVKRETRRRYRWEGAPDPYDSMTAWISKQSVSLAPTGKRAPKQYVPVAPGAMAPCSCICMIQFILVTGGLKEDGSNHSQRLK